MSSIWTPNNISPLRLSRIPSNGTSQTLHCSFTKFKYMLIRFFFSILAMVVSLAAVHAQALLNVQLEQDDKPAAEVLLQLRSPDGQITDRQQTDAQGKARFEALNKGQRYTIVVMDGKTVVSERDVQIPDSPGQISLQLNIQLQKARSQSRGTPLDEGMARLEVRFTDMQDKPLTDQRIDFDAINGDAHYSGTTDDQGQFSLEVAKGQRYKVAYYSPEGVKQFDPIAIPDKQGQMTMRYSLQMERSMAMSGDRFTLENVYFATDKATLRPESQPALNKLVRFLKGRAGVRVEIAGHTDSRASEAYNRQLSQARAEAVRQYCIEQGIDSGRVVARGYGESEPIAPNETKTGRAQNRRTEVRILSR